jgi:hypothetical protein
MCLLGLGLAGTLTLVTCVQENWIPTKTEKPQSDYSLSIKECKRELAVHTEIPGSPELRRLICEDLSLYQKGQFNKEQALYLYITIANTVRR